MCIRDRVRIKSGTASRSPLYDVAGLREEEGVRCVVLRQGIPKLERKFSSGMLNSTFAYKWVVGAAVAPPETSDAYRAMFAKKEAVGRVVLLPGPAFRGAIKTSNDIGEQSAVVDHLAVGLGWVKTNQPHSWKEAMYCSQTAAA